MKVLIVVTSHDKLGDTGNPTGFWLEELAAPYYVFKDAGAEVTIASPQGGQVPIDPKSQQPEFQTEATHRFNQDSQAKAAIANTVKLSTVSPSDYDSLFYPGGHGPLWDLAQDSDSIRLIETMYQADKPVAAVCHGPCVFREAKVADGSPLVQGKPVTSFSNTEESAVGLTEVVPFLVEDELKAKGGHYSRTDDWHPHVVSADNLITGQNPASSEATAKAVLEQLSVNPSQLS